MNVEKIANFLERCRVIQEPRFHNLASTGESHGHLIADRKPLL